MLIHLFFLPVFFNRIRIVHHIPQPENGSGVRATSPEPLERRQNLFFQSQGLLVHNKKVRLKCFGRGGDDIFTDIEGMLGIDFNGEGQIFIVGFFNHSRNPDKIDSVRKRETTGNGGTGQDQDIDAGSQQMGCDGHRSADVSETIGVMGIHQDVIGRVAGHCLFGSSFVIVVRKGKLFANPLYHIQKAASNFTVKKASLISFNSVFRYLNAS